VRLFVLFKGDVYKVQMFIAHFFPLKGQGLSILSIEFSGGGCLREKRQLVLAVCVFIFDVN